MDACATIGADDSPVWNRAPDFGGDELLYGFCYILVRVCYYRRRSVGTDQLATAIDSLLAVDPNELPDTELHHLVTTIQRQRHRMAVVAASALSAWDTRMEWADNGAGSAAVEPDDDADTDADSADGRFHCNP